MLRVSNSLPDTLIVEVVADDGNTIQIQLLDAHDLLSGRLEQSIIGAGASFKRTGKRFEMKGPAVSLNGEPAFRGQIVVEVDEELQLKVTAQPLSASSNSELPPKLYNDIWHGFDPDDQSWGE